MSKKNTQPAKKPVAKKPEPKPQAASVAKDTGRRDMAGKYMGASSPLEVPGGRGMSAQMAAAVQKNPSAYSGYSNPSQGTPRYNY